MKNSTQTSTAQKIARRSAAGLAGVALAGAGLAGMAAPATAASTSTWDKLAQCESGGNWSINTGNGYYGGVQFSPSSWRAAGGSGMPHQASKAEQIRVAENLLSMQGWGAWPACSSKLGLSGKGTYTSAPAQKQAAPKKQVQKAAPKKQVQKAAPKKQVQKAAPQRTQQAAPQQRTQQAAPQQALQRTAQVAPSGQTITVKPGDTMSKLAKAHGVDGGWKALFAANTNTVSNPNLIFVGQTLNLPAN